MGSDIMPKIYNREYLLNYQRDLRKMMTKSEVVVWKYIKSNQLGLKFRRQYGIGNYIVDFYCPRIKLAIEIDGVTHIEESVFENDQKKEEYLKEIGIVIKRYTSEDVFKNLRAILDDLWRTCEELKTSPCPSLLRRG